MMKTSNKILLSVVVVILVVLTAIHFALSSKYKSGDVTVAKTTGGKDSINIAKVRYVRIEGLDNVKLVPSYNYRIETQKSMPSYFKYAVNGDTLTVKGDTSDANAQGVQQHRKVYEEVSLHLPQMAMVTVINSNLAVTGKMAADEVGIIRLELIGSRLSFENHFHINDASQYFGDVFIFAKQGSEIELSSTTLNFRTLACELQQSTFTDNQTGNIDQFSIKTDDSSVVRISGRNFQKLNSPVKTQ